MLRIESAVAHQLASAMEVVSALPGNPDRFSVRHFRCGVACASGAWPGTLELNVANCVGLPDDLEQEEICEMLRQTGAVPHIKVTENAASRDWIDGLLSRGWSLRKTEARTCGSPMASPPTFATGIDVRIGETQDDFDTYTELLMEGFLGAARKRHDPPGGSVEWERLRLFHCNPTRRCFVANCDGVPAGHGTLYAHEGVAYLGPAATLPRFRNRGVHTALLQARMHHAHLANCDLVVCGADLESISLRNQERQGLRAVWNRAHLIGPKPEQ